MALTKTLNFLPSVFQTESNDKFLSVTLDQLVTEPNLTPINGYVGRKFTPGYTGIESYIREPSRTRADYQLEPTVVVKNKEDDAKAGRKLRAAFSSSSTQELRTLCG